MGNGVTKVSHCFASSGDVSRRHDIAPLHEGLGHSFCYFRPEIASFSNFSNKIHSEEMMTFRSISGASVSANTSTPSSTTLLDICSYSSGLDCASTFESSESFKSLPLQPVPRSGSIELGSGSAEWGFLSGPVEREKEKEKVKESDHKLQGIFSHGRFVIDEIEVKPRKQSLIKTLKRKLSNTISHGKKSMVRSIRDVKESVTDRNGENANDCSADTSGPRSLNIDVEDDDSQFSIGSHNLQWAQGKAGEDRVHIVISEEHGWVFVGIYDGFNGPDAPDYLLSNLYANVHKELKGWLGNDKFDPILKIEETEEISCSIGKANYSYRKQGKNLRPWSKHGAKKCEENQRWWRCELDWKLKEQFPCKGSNFNVANHSDVLEALSRALKKTENSYLEMAVENPELALMGSCVLAMIMKGQDVYLMNVGDSRAILAQKTESNLGSRIGSQDLEMISEESMCDLEVFDACEFYRLHNLHSLQLTMDHSTYVDKEVRIIKKKHRDDPCAIMNERVKGYLKVTRAFGAGFLKQPKLNDLLLEMFRIDYIGNSPYITCNPSLYHHRLSTKDRFLIMSSDGLYQYFTNEEAVSEVESFLAAFPEGDPAQHLIEEVLFRAAKKAGLDFHELLDIPQGERRRYHDDVSVIIISLEGRIWRSSV